MPARLVPTVDRRRRSVARYALVMLTASRIRFVVIEAPRLQHRSARVTGYRISMDYDDGDLPPDEY
jgi:hypothetical protein